MTMFYISIPGELEQWAKIGDSYLPTLVTRGEVDILILSEGPRRSAKIKLSHLCIETETPTRTSAL